VEGEWDQVGRRSTERSCRGQFTDELGLLWYVSLEPMQSTVEIGGLVDDVCQDILIEEARAEGGFHSFCGDDSCENCEGWDGSSHRCECGNRRVSWDSDGDFTNMIIYGNAN